MTHYIFDASETPASASFLSNSVSGAGGEGTAQFSGPDTAAWVLAGLEYTGTPGGIGTWTHAPSDLHVGFWALRNPAGQVVGYASTETLASMITDAMTDYPGEFPG
jgi:hypothetical protein